MVTLLDVRDELTVAKNFIACVYLACHHMAPGVERAALCEVTNAAREKLEEICVVLDQLISGDARINEVDQGVLGA